MPYSKKDNLSDIVVPSISLFGSVFPFPWHQEVLEVVTAVSQMDLEIGLKHSICL